MSFSTSTLTSSSWSSSTYGTNSFSNSFNNQLDDEDNIEKGSPRYQPMMDILDSEEEYSLESDSTNSLSSSFQSESSLSNSEADMLITTCKHNNNRQNQVSIIDSSNQLSNCFSLLLEPLSLLSPNNTFLKVSEDELLEEFPNVNTVNSIFAERTTEESTTYFLYRPHDLELLVKSLESDHFHEQMTIKTPYYSSFRY